LRQVLARIIATGRLDNPSLLDDVAVRQLARDEGVLPLLESIGGGSVRELRVHAAVQLARRVRITRLLNALAAEGVTALVFKGAQLAYTCYPDPALRPHVDTDVFIDPDDVERVRRVFQESGHRLIPHVTGRFVMSQFHFTDGEVGGVHAYDVHWRIANPVVFRPVLPFKDVFERSKPFEAYGAHARGPSLPDALLIASVHRAAHHGATERLIWMNDVRLLLNAASPAELDEFRRLADRYRVSALAHDTCARAAALFGVRVPDRALSARAASEPSRAYLSAPSRVRQLTVDVWALRGWRERLTLVREHAFPPATYIVQSASSRAPLPWLYATRIVRGASQWIAASLPRFIVRVSDRAAESDCPARDAVKTSRSA
jgi:putative nucleotidyltransferase-like protein